VRPARAAPAGPPRVEAAPPPAPPRVEAAALPTLERWRTHLADELMPYWTTPDALGTPIGNFPTLRCPDGTAYRAAAPCLAAADLPAWLRPELGRDHARMKSRQTYAYGVAFHVTGDPRYLGYARAGVAWLRAHAYDRATGSAISYWEAGRPGPALGRRTAQDLAYTQLGLAFYYYLTRDPAVLEDVVRLHRYLMAAYWDPQLGGGMLRWVLEDGDAPGDAQREELVAQLDPINAYLLLVAPIVEAEAVAAELRRDLLTLARVIRARFFAPELGMFWGATAPAAERRLGGRHLDFGHSMKALWMLYLAGGALGEPALADFARPLVAPLLTRAALPSGCWSSGPRPGGGVSQSSEWWIAAELDQAAATLALREPADADGRAPAAYARHLAPGYACWLDRFVDRRPGPAGGEVWPFARPDWPPERLAASGILKAHAWKSGYHSTEHALVALITTAGLTGQRLPLYFALAVPTADARLQPYYFRGRAVARRAHPLPGHADLRGVAIELADLR
jgi:mannose/cellobiose epimerase-like protein (N-acyl-D-glucosamine 2-epimerase family)